MKEDMQIHYWAHMLDEAFDKSDDKNSSKLPDGIKKLNKNSSVDTVLVDVTNDSLEDCCKNLEFLLHTNDDKAIALYNKFKEGFKKKF